MAYDVITVGGGLAGASLAKGLAERGVKVLVLERETAFKDRVRGEQIHPWGVAELRQLGLYDRLHEACGHELPWLDMFLWPQQIAHRDLTVSTPQQAPEFSFYHPAMQETLAQAAEEAGAEVRRGVRSQHPPGEGQCKNDGCYAAPVVFHEIARTERAGQRYAQRQGREDQDEVVRAHDGSSSPPCAPRQGRSRCAPPPPPLRQRSPVVDRHLTHSLVVVEEMRCVGIHRWHAQ